MVNNKEISKLLLKWSVEEIEKHLIYSYILIEKLDFNKSPILINYFEGFNNNKTLILLIKKLNIRTLKDLENTLELLIPGNDRKLNGAFFTPNYIVDFIIENIQPQENDKNLDPSCGCGAFLIGLVTFYEKKHNKSIQKIIRENIFGSDIMPYNIHRTKLILTTYALSKNEILKDDDFNLVVQDSTKTDWTDSFVHINGKFDNIVGNPPYVKFQDLSDENRKYLSKNYKTVRNGTFNLYFAFFELGYKLISKTGKLGYITPNNYFTSLAAEPLRLFFQNEECVTRIVDFKDKKVFDAQTYTAITFLNKKTNPEIFYDRIPKELEPNIFIKNANGSPNKLSELNHKKWRLLKTKEQKNIKNIETIGDSIGQLFNIAVGVATLKDEIYFIDKNTEKQGYYYKQHNNINYPIEKSITKSIYKISDFKGQKDISSNKRKIIFPYKLINGSAISYSENELLKLFPKTYEYFQSTKLELAKRDKGKKISPFYAYGRTQGLTRKGEMILTPTFSKYPRFLIAQENDAFFCNGYGMYFKEETGGLWANNTNPISKLENIEILQKILNSQIMHYYVETTSVSIQGGYPCYQKNFIEKFTIPNFENKDLNILRNLTDKYKIDEFLIEKYQLSLSVPNLVS